MEMQKFVFQEIDQKAKNTAPVDNWDTWYDSLPKIENFVSYTEEEKEIRLSFERKPNEETRDTIKRAKFRWDKNRLFWTRKLDKNAQKAFQKFVKETNAQAI